MQKYFIITSIILLYLFPLPQAVGGRGGGKPGLAQGSVGAPDTSKLELALKEARNYLDSVSASV